MTSTDQSPPARPPRLPATEGPRLVLRRVIIALILVGCAIGMKIAVDRTDTGEAPIVASGGSQVVERQVPRDGAEALRQTEISIDLAPLWTGELYVNGQPIPEDQIIRVDALNLMRFVPGEGKAVTELEPGQNCATALIWTVDQGRPERPESVNWCFEVT